ncbi:RDD family protein [Peribacillus alkalitolerans]|uniref:RDD family protein n=1 Tax=Peribacillus alkalitolerans TaxID=1550385 RepID=UPI0013D086A4|nr:RDD family protein [Peribacillus alkalitolerans]
MNQELNSMPSYNRLEYAGFWIRFGAYLIDSIIVGIIMAIISSIAAIAIIGNSIDLALFLDPEYIPSGSEIGAFVAAYAVIIIIGLIISVLYYAVMQSSKWQATIGKKLLGLKVTDVHGNRIGFGRSIGRLLVYSFLSPIFMIGFIIAAFTEKKQALHDLIAGTLVIKK